MVAQGSCLQKKALALSGRPRTFDRQGGIDSERGSPVVTAKSTRSTPMKADRYRLFRKMQEGGHPRADGAFVLSEAQKESQRMSEVLAKATVV